MIKKNAVKNPPHKLKVKSSLLDKINTIPDRYSERNIVLFFLIGALAMALINFNARISEAHDDALYLEAAYRFVSEFPNYFYTANAPFYPMFLAILIKTIGFHLLVFKSFNVIFLLLSVYFFFKTFFRKVPFAVLLPMMFFVSFNHLILYFASMTFTESLFMFLQSVVFYFSGKLIEQLSTDKVPSFKTGWNKNLWLLGLFVFLLLITRSGAIVIIPTLLFFYGFILRNKKYTLLSLLSVLTFYVPYKIIVRWIFGNVSQYSNQFRILSQKDPYDASLGREDLSGFMSRFFDNSNLYLSKRFFQIIGWMNEQNTSTYSILAFIMWILFLSAIWKVYKHQHELLLFSGLYTLGLITLSFIILQARWDQARIIMVAMPVMLLLFFYLFYQIFSSSSLGRTIYLLLLFLLISSISISTIKRGIKNIPIVLKNLQGDRYYGYTPDWQNFLKASEWCGNHLSKDALVASRKAPMSFIYGKRRFFPIYSVIKKDPKTNQSNPDSALLYFKQNKVTHILLANLRIDPTKNTGQVINTIHNIIEPIIQKYPTALKLIHTEGETEACMVYEIVYPENIK